MRLPIKRPSPVPALRRRIKGLEEVCHAALALLKHIERYHPRPTRAEAALRRTLAVAIEAAEVLPVRRKRKQ